MKTLAIFSQNNLTFEKTRKTKPFLLLFNVKINSTKPKKTMRKLLRFLLIFVAILALIMIFRKSPIKAMAFQEEPNSPYIEKTITGEPETIYPEIAGMEKAKIDEGILKVIGRDGFYREYSLAQKKEIKKIELPYKHIDGYDIWADVLYGADMNEGLVKINLKNPAEHEVLVSHFGGRKLVFVDDCIVAKNGDIYFTNASEVFGADKTTLETLAMNPTGDILRYNPRIKTCKMILENKYFPNGLTLLEDQQSLIFTETLSRSVKKVHVGEDTDFGKVFPLATGLPSYTDNVFEDEKGNFWVGLPAQNDPMVSALKNFPKVREAISKILPLWVANLLTKDSGRFMHMDTKTGQNTIYNIESKTPKFVTNVVPYNGKIYLSSFTYKGVWVFDEP
ncbi:MAG: hypothetical protein C4K58_00430 [Flavobacteriaceae bacterium]|nr:MAG: hypothetical protein C4K58_00430 [Flavobacteriaceae bacterium]